LKPLDFKQKRSGQSELKILVSVVRFRPRPPENLQGIKKPRYSKDSGVFLLGGPAAVQGRRDQSVLRAT
jgi:hypothetical protein